MPLCTSCAYPAEHLYTTYSSKSNIRLGVCVQCGNFLDPLIEHPPLLLILDLILLKPRVFLHLLFNRNVPPKDGSVDASKAPSSEEPSKSRHLWSDWMNLALATVAAESMTRTMADNTTVDFYAWHILTVVITVITELIAQHAITTAVALCAVRLKVWQGVITDAGAKDGRQKHFRPIMISLTLLYAGLLPLVLHLFLGIWYTQPGFQLFRPVATPSRYLRVFESLPEPVWTALMCLAQDLSDSWHRSDRIWVGTKLLGGMSAGFGLRVIMPTRPIETTAIVLAGWLAAGLVGRSLLYV